MDAIEAWALKAGSRVRRKLDGRILRVVRVVRWTQGPLVWCTETESAHPEPWAPTQLEHAALDEAAS
ncbi:MAG: hypothetical protein AAGE52_09020 [Myxococcota bacterium]